MCRGENQKLQFYTTRLLMEQVEVKQELFDRFSVSPTCVFAFELASVMYSMSGGIQYRISEKNMHHLRQLSTGFFLYRK